MKILLLIFYVLIQICVADIIRSPLSGGIESDGVYYASINIGTPPKQYLLIADTGSSLLIVETDVCTSCKSHGTSFYSINKSSTSSRIACSSSICRSNACGSTCPGSCQASTRACCANNSYQQCGFYSGYADGTKTTGGYLTDICSAVPLEGSSLRNVTTYMGGIEYMSGSFDDCDGILGLAYKSIACSPTCVNTFLDSLVNTYSEYSNMFTMCFGNTEGVLSFGGNDASLYSGNLTWIDTQSGGYYTTSLNDIRVNGETVFSSPRSYTIIADSGTTLIVVQSSIFASLKSYFQKNYCSLSHVCGSNTLFDGYCFTSGPTSAWPTIDLYLDGLYLSIPPDLYFVRQTTGKTIYYCLAFYTLSSTSSLNIIGEAVLRGYTVVHDKENDRFGFGIPTSSCHVDTTGGIDETVYKPFDIMQYIEYIIIGFIALVLSITCVIDCAKKNKRNKTKQLQRHNANPYVVAQPTPYSVSVDLPPVSKESNQNQPNYPQSYTPPSMIYPTSSIPKASLASDQPYTYNTNYSGQPIVAQPVLSAPIQGVRIQYSSDNLTNNYNSKKSKSNQESLLNNIS